MLRISNATNHVLPPHNATKWYLYLTLLTCSQVFGLEECEVSVTLTLDPSSSTAYRPSVWDSLRNLIMKFVTRKKKTDIIAFDNVPLEKQSNAATCQLPLKCLRQLHISATLLSTLSIYSLIMSLTSFTATYFLYFSLCLAFKVRFSCLLSIIHFHFS